MKATTDLSKGNVFKYKDQIYKIIEQPTRLQPGRAKSFVLLTTHNVDNGRKMEFKFSTSDKVETVDIIHKKVDFLYHDNNTAYFSDDIEYPLDKINFAEFLNEGMEVIVDIIQFSNQNDNRIVDIELPLELQGKVISNNGSMIILEHDIRIDGPKFIVAGELIYFNRETLKCIGRVNGYTS